MTETHNDPEELARRVASLSAQNERLAQILVEARSKIVGLQQQIDDLAQPPAPTPRLFAHTPTAPLT